MERGGDETEREHGTERGVLVAGNVRRAYGDTVALDGVSLAVDAGEVFCLIGPNGAGKTTLVRALTGTTHYEGQVSVFGSAPTEIDRSRVGLLPQEFAPATRLTARELLTYYAGLYDDARDPDTLLADLGLEDASDTRYEDLSGGQRRRVCVGTALVNDPELLFLDEPTTGIDPAGRRALWRLLEERVAGGTTIFLTTHDMAEAERLADRVGLLADGRLVEVGCPQRLVATHGGESRLTIDLSESPNVGALALSGTEYRTDTRGDELVVYDVSPEEIGRVVHDLNDESVAYDGLAWSQPNLEDAYLRLTGTAVGRGGDPIEPSSALESVDGTEESTGADGPHEAGELDEPDEESEANGDAREDAAIDAPAQPGEKR